MERKCENFLEDLLGSMRRSEKYSDFVLEVGGDDIPVHRSVLSSASPYFEKMFSVDAIEKTNGGAKISELDPEAVKTCIDFIYSGKAPMSLENPEQLIHASDLMDIPQLKEMYFGFLTDNVTVDTCLLYAGLASKYHAGAITDKLLRYTSAHFEEVFNKMRIPEMDKKELCEVIDLLPENLQNCEIQKWIAIKTWVKADEEKRGKNFPDLFKLLQLVKIPLEYLAKEILLSDLVKNSKECKRATITSLSTENQRPLMMMKDIYGPLVATDLLHFSTKKPTHVVARNGQSPWLHTMDLSTYKWSRYARLPRHLRGLPIIGVIGGVYLQTKDGDLVGYSNEKWEKICTLESHLRNCLWIGFGDCIWFIEGNCIRNYNPFTNTWAKLLENPGLHSVSACAISKERILVIGKIKGNTSRAKEYDFRFHEWDEISSDSKTTAGAFIVNTTCVTWNTSGELKEYNPNIDEWVALQNISKQPNFRKIRKVIGSDQYFYVFGESRGAVCNCSPFQVSQDFNAPTKFSDFCLI